MDKNTTKRAAASSSIPKSEKIISKYSKTFKLLIKCLKNDLINHSHLNSKVKPIKEEIPLNNNGNEQEKEKKKRGRPRQAKPNIAKAPRVSLPTSSSLEEDLNDDDLIDALEETKQKQKQNNNNMVVEDDFDKPDKSIFTFGQSKDNNTYDNKAGIDYKGVNQLFK